MENATIPQTIATSDQPDHSPDLIPQGNVRWRPKGLTQLLDLQESCYIRAMKAKTGNKDFSALALAFTRLEEAIRIRRGIPLPGQLRPDLDREQIKRSMKRAKARGLVMEIGDGSRMIDDDEQPPEVNTSESKAPKTPTRPPKKPIGDTAKESL